jgi:ABC-type transport system substrate-binding protein
LKIFNIWLNAEPSHYASMWAYQPYSYFMKEAWKVDNWTVRISFWDRASGAPMPASYASLISIPMLPKHMLDGHDYSYVGFNWTGVYSDAESPGMPIVGTGPFMATPDIYNDWLAGDHITLVRNPDCHWLPDYGKEIKFDQIVLKFFQEPTSMLLALENKAIDAAAYPPNAYQAIKDGVAAGTIHNITTFDGPKITQYFTEIGFCMNNAGPNPSRLDPVIREALHMATNKQYIVDNMYNGLADVGSTLISPMNPYWHYEPSAAEEFEYNLTAAAALLQANGYVDIDSDGIRECTISSSAVQLGYVVENTKMVYQMVVRRDHPEEKDIAQYLQSQWHQIGVQFNYMIVEELTLSTIVYSYNYDSMIWYWSGDIDPNYLLFTQTQIAWNGWSDDKYYNPSYEENYTLSVETLDDTSRKGYVDNCQEIFYNDSAYIIMAYPHQTYAWRTDTFTGWGNWSADPGRSLDNYWTGNPLFFDLEPVVDTIPPVAVAVATPSPANFGDLVTLDGSQSTDDIGPIVDYNWTFEYAGTGLELHGMVIGFVFAIEGTYNITLNCTDAAGNYNATTVQLLVNPAIPEFGSMPLVVLVLLLIIVLAGETRRKKKS